MRTPERVIFFDPGPRPGWARADLRENRIARLNWGVSPREDTAIVLHDSMAAHDMGGEDDPLYNVIGYETFRPRPEGGTLDWIQGNELVEARFIGQLELASWLYGAELVPQEPSQKTAALASMPANLRAIMDDAGEQHAKDAIMHLWLYAFRNFVTDPRAVAID